MASTPWIWWISSFKGCNLEEIGCRQPWNFLLWKIAPAPLAIIFLVDFIWKIRHKLLQSGRGQLPPALEGFSWKSSSCMITLHSPSSCWTHRLLIKRDLIQRPRQFRAMAPGALCSQADPLPPADGSQHQTCIQSRAITCHPIPHPLMSHKPRWINLSLKPSQGERNHHFDCLLSPGKSVTSHLEINIKNQWQNLLQFEAVTL